MTGFIRLVIDIRVTFRISIPFRESDAPPVFDWYKVFAFLRLAGKYAGGARESQRCLNGSLCNSGHVRDTRRKFVVIDCWRKRTSQHIRSFICGNRKIEGRRIEFCLEAKRSNFARWSGFPRVNGISLVSPFNPSQASGLSDQRIGIGRVEKIVVRIGLTVLLRHCSGGSNEQEQQNLTGVNDEIATPQKNARQSNSNGRTNDRNVTIVRIRMTLKSRRQRIRRHTRSARLSGKCPL